MKTGVIVALVAAGILGVLVAIPAISYVSYYNEGASQEAGLQAQYSNMQNILAQYSLKVTEAAQVPQIYTKDLVSVTKAAISGRYGANGSQATWQWIKEHNPNVDPSMFIHIQQIIEGGRDNFQVSQTQFLDMKRVYQVELNSFWSGIWLHAAGYPKKPLDSYKLITSESAQQAFKTGVDQGIKLPQ